MLFRSEALWLAQQRHGARWWCLCQSRVEPGRKGVAFGRGSSEGLTGSASRKRGELGEVHGGGDSPEKILAEGKKTTAQAF